MNMEHLHQLQKLCQVETKRLLLVMGIIAFTIILVQSVSLPYRNVLLSLFPTSRTLGLGKSGLAHDDSIPESEMVHNSSLLNDSNSNNSTMPPGVVTNFGASHTGEEIKDGNETKRKDEDHQNGLKSEDVGPENATELYRNKDLSKESSSVRILDLDKNSTMGDAKDRDNSSAQAKAGETQDKGNFTKLDGNFPLDNVQKENNSVVPEKIGTTALGTSPPFALPPEDSSSGTFLRNLDANSNTSIPSVNSNTSSVIKQSVEAIPNDEKSQALLSGPSMPVGNSTITNNPVTNTPKSDVLSSSIMSLSDMNHLLSQSRAASQPKGSSARDQELLLARSQIENSPIVKKDIELYAPLFRNVSKFKMSYELMERMLKVYIYKEGERPIFHQPPLKGIYASEGWFMKLMEANKHFVVKDPRKAHLFYLPFSSRMLEETLYVPNSHNQKNLIKHLKNYIDMIAAKYPFWNRTGGSDHFLVACHDWAPSETRQHMALCIKALCNADVSGDFKIGKDVSLPETYVRVPRDPLRDLGGKPLSKRSILAFFAGSMHGYVRPILLKYWENKDPDMKIFGRMGRSGKSKMNYIQHMKSSKYCICAKGYEVNSPRVVEAIFYECVPVIISDNFVPPFFEVLDWEAFSVFVLEKDIPNLKNILLSIPEEKYRRLQLGVKKAQRHFLWHTTPVKYDIFHMILHSVWYNRVFQIGT
ncbi:PREDICTED: probable glycosyltransferase At3g07620 isoform X2 [Nelumbo nucifera]|uniref:Exostosin GT47 domain-containing protein n=2 Tax=Nelumbo nucifera TaxID=4432 RepID=A0A822Y683_NELNU|nr:PREDICTED: probable glycosyltransferase At3g07620 isoform X2 [Nelumbo nucifera]DAD26839.1 TPA_asm: hypothetical protein HUJ06_028307 [Nelumbo nucifera]